MSRQDNLDLIIAEAIKEIEQEAEKDMPSPEDAWKDFEARIRENKSNRSTKFHRFINIKSALVACLALLLVLTSQSRNVVAFKNELVRWIGKDNRNQTIIVEHENPEIEERIYSDLTFAEAQEMTLFHLVKPTYLPAGINDSPDIEVNVYGSPWALVKMTYYGENQKLLIIKQENSSGKGQRNTFIPENNEIKEISLANKNIIIIKNNDSISVRWVENGIRYGLLSHKIPENELLEVIKSLK